VTDMDGSSGAVEPWHMPTPVYILAGSYLQTRLLLFCCALLAHRRLHLHRRAVLRTAARVPLTFWTRRVRVMRDDLFFA